MTSEELHREMQCVCVRVCVAGCVFLLGGGGEGAEAEEEASDGAAQRPVQI